MRKGIKQNRKIANRRRKVALRRFWYFFKIFLMLVFFGAAIYGLNFFYNSDYFKIKEIDIRGNEHYTREELMYHLSEYRGENIFEVDKKMVEDTLLSDLFWLKSVDLKKVFPDHVNITLVERKPYIRAYYKGEYFLLDREGVVLDMNKEQTPEQEKIIVVKNALNHKPELGDKIAKRNALSCGDIYINMDSQLKELFKEARLEKSGDIVFVTEDNKKVIFGSRENIPQKIGILKELLKDDMKYNIIDLNNYEIPVVN
ncbi:MAG: cell division protein FtsQ/DivIB [Actinomycetota bacterium]